VQQAPVVYIALEGRHGFPARAEAFRRHYGVESAPFYLLPASLDLVAKSGQLIASIKTQLGENLPGVLFLDTLNRSLVGSESKDEDMARFLAAAEKVAQELSCAVVIVHHCGIDASRPRGHTSLSGAVESQLKVERTAAGEVVVTVQSLRRSPQRLLRRHPLLLPPAVAGRPAPGGAPSSANTQTEVALRANCGPDVKKLCSGISWENGGVIRCLNSHRMELSPICVAHFNGQKGAPKATSPNR
jgi:hypothetical protein